MATSSASSGSSSTSSNNNNNKGKGKRSQWQDEVWIHFAQNERDSQGHATATCNYCQVKYMRGEISTL